MRIQEEIKDNLINIFNEELTKEELLLKVIDYVNSLDCCEGECNCEKNNK